MTDQHIGTRPLLQRFGVEEVDFIFPHPIYCTFVVKSKLLETGILDIKYHNEPSSLRIFH